ncbi:TPA: hypothetical protein N0J77_004148 [Pseudomonas aeruginosa]|uniref:hypothetical protein n=1 Tax=Pseudomonas aeruginosa TaxID=287 RepID=UPI000F53F1BF|nr:hypothetical protein [Pseudomonas aeruginosa]MCD2753919.1 hypothetical protein [Pseudomonas aeruginosa]WOJ12142.1 hypothetical protein M0M55_27215 [Pseudomonas aeruginosa]HCK4323422.1 hypothetical protein [Pseudomonas aeruginosa]HCK5624635.1 hypothetical protein [Pseudomonas aeruginosa]
MNRQSSPNELKTILHTLISTYSPAIDDLMIKTNGTSYFAHFLEPDINSIQSFHQEDQFNEMIKVYLIGILERCHLTCITSLARTNNWLKSSLSQLESNNLLGFSASLRGLLEATADAHDATLITLKYLYNCFPFIYLRTAKSNTSAKPIVLEELEDRLIHYTYARKHPKGSTPLPHHTNKSNADYIKAIEQHGATGAMQLYSKLCELTHPASPSISCFLQQSDKHISLDFSQEKQIINGLLSEYSLTIERIATLTINSALTSLIILKKMGLRTPAPAESSFSYSADISKILGRINDFIDKSSRDGFIFAESMWHTNPTRI